MRKPKFYHATPIDNWHKIRSEGLLPGPDGAVHLTTNKNKAVAFVAMRPGVKTVSLFSVKVAEDQVKPFYDGTLSGDDCYVFDGPIEPDKIELVNNFGGRPTVD